jgi:hypothetical protein
MLYTFFFLVASTFGRDGWKKENQSVFLRPRWSDDKCSKRAILVKIEIARDRNKKNRLVAQLRLFFESLPLMVKAAAENNKIFFPTTYLCMYVHMRTMLQKTWPKKTCEQAIVRSSPPEHQDWKVCIASAVSLLFYYVHTQKQTQPT